MHFQEQSEGLVGCRVCGIVARRLSEIGEGARCPSCGRPLGSIRLEEARTLVIARRRAEQQRSDAMKAAEVGLDQTIKPI